MSKSMHRWTAGLVAGMLTLTAGGCGGGGEGAAKSVAKLSDPAGAIEQNENLSVAERTALVDRLWEEGAKEGGIDHEARRERIKKVVWSVSSGADARVRGIEILAADPMDVGGADTRRMLALMLPSEPMSAVVDVAARLTIERGWVELAPALTRSLARGRGPGSQAPASLRARMESKAIVQVLQVQSLEQGLTRVFVMPTEVGAREAESDRMEKARAAAWQVLGWLDPTGSQRRALLGEEANRIGPDSADISKGLADLGVLALTADELDWLRDTRKPENSGWWEQSKAGVAQLGVEQRDGLALRHIEAVRWASSHRGDWLKASRTDLFGQLVSRLEGRRRHFRGEGGARGGERVETQGKGLSWGDCLTLLVIDELAGNGDDLAKTLAKQAQSDRADQTTEYGGALLIQEARVKMGLLARMYPPRGTQRLNDNQFVASQELLDAAATGMGVYHFHAQKEKNSSYAGPSDGDMEYADRSRRTCVVFTPVKEGAFNVDVFWHGPAGPIVVDLGELGAGGWASGKGR